MYLGTDDKCGYGYGYGYISSCDLISPHLTSPQETQVEIINSGSKISIALLSLSLHFPQPNPSISTRALRTSAAKFKPRIYPSIHSSTLKIPPRSFHNDYLPTYPSPAFTFTLDICLLLAYEHTLATHSSLPLFPKP
ncbi:hypothetical protein OCU04_009929 [Sclerotinia nivalis]|uniref:Uncharacterized protein n=1 Tax=Sclerotinia nivalis TaxID=352851 RepID=A0A9X0ADI2_9HELO|nr:hypothetical protein OCU04_009929 [Sclerotinia nivalis]